MLLISLGSVLAISGVITSAVINGNVDTLIKADEVSYSLSLSASDFISSSFDKVTSGGGYVKINTDNVSTLDNKIVLDDTSSIYNPYLGNATHNAVTRIKSILVSYSGLNNLYVDYAYGESLASVSPTYSRTDNVLISNYTYNFNNNEPNYFKLKADGDVSISSITITYSCSDVDYTDKDNVININNDSDFNDFVTKINNGTYNDESALYNLNYSVSNLNNIVIGSITHPFKGTFNGNNHNIENITISKKENYVGLFGYIMNATIMNLNINNVDVIQEDRLSINRDSFGIVCGRGENVTFTNISVDSNSSVSGRQAVGSIIGKISHGGRFINIDNRADVETIKSDAGGLVGNIYNVSNNNTYYFNNCSNSGSVHYATTSGSTASGIGGIIGRVRLSNNECLLMNNCTNNGIITGYNEVGGIVGVIKEFNRSLPNKLYMCTNNGNIIDNFASISHVAGIEPYGNADFDHCYCLGSATIAVTQNDVRLASSLSDVGGSNPGYICQQKNSYASLTSCGLIL